MTNPSSPPFSPKDQSIMSDKMREEIARKVATVLEESGFDPLCMSWLQGGFEVADALLPLLSSVKKDLEVPSFEPNGSHQESAMASEASRYVAPPYMVQRLWDNADLMEKDGRELWAKDSRDAADEIERLAIQSDKWELETLRLRRALEDAKEAVQSWGAYASEYFQEKWDLAGDIAAIDAALSVRDRSGSAGETRSGSIRQDESPSDAQNQSPTQGKGEDH
jgi:hypothetical protein